MSKVCKKFTYLTDEEFGGLLIAPDLSEGHGARPVPVGLLHTTSGGGGLPGSLGGQLLPRGLSSSGFSGSLLGSGHLQCLQNKDDGTLVSLKCSLVMRSRRRDSLKVNYPATK